MVLTAVFGLAEGRAGDPWFGIQVIDDVTKRGVPLVELETVNKIKFITDSSGWVAIQEPGWSGEEVFFNIRSHGYEYRKDGFGFAGKAVKIVPGGRVKIPIKRISIAERIYRITGEGIYRDSILLGEPAPIKQPLLNAKVLGQDTVFTAIYHGQIFWLWGDTDRIRYPLGNFRTSCAVSDLPGKGGLDPYRGIDLEYFVDDKEGFSKQMCPAPEIKGGPIWLTALASLRDKQGNERLVARYTNIEGMLTVKSHGIVAFNDEKKIFEPSLEIPMSEPWRFPEGHTLFMKEGGKEWLLFIVGGRPVVRTLATYEGYLDAAGYEAFTCLADGSKFDEGRTKVLRDSSGQLQWRWTRNADPLTQEQEEKLIKAKIVSVEEARFQFTDSAGKPVKICNGSVNWNPYLKAYILIGQEHFGSSLLGELVFAAAPSPTGPWKKTVKIVTHDNYTFYNPNHHVFLDQEDGRYVYLEGTYVDTFSGNPVKTARYNYNQVMYRLDLSDLRLKPSIP